LADPHVSDLQRLIEDYGRAWDAEDLPTILNSYSTPCFVTIAGRVDWNVNEEEKRSCFDALLRSYQSRNCAILDPPEFQVLSLEALGRSSALVTVRWICRDESGGIAGENTDSYLFARVEAEWKILGGIGHED
jgi:hypothetical protein